MQSLEKKVRLLEEENELMKGFLMRRRTHPDIMKEEETRKQVICETHSSTEKARITLLTHAPHPTRCIHRPVSQLTYCNYAMEQLHTDR
jgi:hypothetical protein